MNPVFYYSVAAVVIIAFAAVFATIKWSAKALEERRAAAGALGLSFLEGQEADENLVLERRLEGSPEYRIPVFIKKLFGSLAGRRISGEYQGLRVMVYWESRNSNSGSRTVTIWKVFYGEALPFKLEIVREGIGSKLAKAFGGMDIEIGDPEFDGRFRVKGDDEAKIRSFLMDPGRKNVLTTGFDACPGIHVTGTHLVCEKSGSISRLEGIKPVLDAMAPLAKAFSK